jgi:hypothetical protein
VYADKVKNKPGLSRSKNIVKCTQYFYDVLIIQRNLSITEHQGNDLFSIAGKFLFVQVLEIWILRAVNFSAKDRFSLYPGCI